jgi:Tfp pilus assembly protein FimT
MSLTELLLAMGLLGLLGSMAWPAWHTALTHTQLKTRAQSLITDAQWAQWQALRLAEPIDLRPLACTASLDWSCGWQVVRPASPWRPTEEVLRERALTPTLRMQASLAPTPWHFDAQGRWHMGAMRVVWSPAGATASGLALTVCVSNTGRWRWQPGAVCSA